MEELTFKNIGPLVIILLIVLVVVLYYNHKRRDDKTKSKEEEQRFLALDQPIEVVDRKQENDEKILIIRDGKKEKHEFRVNENSKYSLMQLWENDE